MDFQIPEQFFNFYFKKIKEKQLLKTLPSCTVGKIYVVRANFVQTLFFVVFNSWEGKVTLIILCKI